MSTCHLAGYYIYWSAVEAPLWSSPFCKYTAAVVSKCTNRAAYSGDMALGIWFVLVA